MIRALQSSDISGLNSFPPSEWDFDFESFLMKFMKKDYFQAFVMYKEDKIVAVGNVLVNDNIGWLGNIIIHKQYRGTGLGSEMTKFLVDYLLEKGCNSILLIATELGKSVYKKIGFEEICDYCYFEAVADVDILTTKSIRQLVEEDVNDVLELDKAATGEKRKYLIEAFVSTGFGFFRDEMLVGFYLPDYGRGLIVSEDTDAGLALLSMKHAKKGSRSLLPIDNKEATDFLLKSGNIQGDKCTKMILGQTPAWFPEHIFAIGSGFCA